MSVRSYKSNFLNLITKLRFRKSVLSEGQVSANQMISPTPPTAIPLWKIITTLPSLFPRSLNDSYQDFKVFQNDPEKIQQELLSTLAFFPSPSEGKVSRIIKTPIDNSGNFINEFCIIPEKPACEPQRLKHLVFIHGYGAGMGFFLKNMEKIPVLENEWCIHYVDLPGFGYSSRTKFPFKYPTDDSRNVEAWFHNNIHTWFKKRNLLEHPENNVVVAHSLGAYLMFLYKTAFPKHFRKLILCSPAGICNGTLKRLDRKPPWWFAKLWEMNASPFSLVRNSHILGSKLTSAWSYRRFKKIASLNQFEALHKYSYAIFNKQGCGEYLLAFVLKCGGDPKFSIERRITTTECKWDKDSDWLWLYGENDWMNISGGNRVTEYLTRNKLGKSRVMVVPDAGHHLYLDNYTFFNTLILNEMRQI